MPELSKNQGTSSENYQIFGARNRVDLWGKVPFVCGRFLVTPPYAAAPYREVVGSNTYWRAIFAISHGPVHIEQLRIGETAIGNYAEVEWQLRRGYWATPDKGTWNPGSGSFPIDPQFGDTWTASRTGTVNGLTVSTGQLQGTLDEFNAVVRTIAQDWDASTDSWVWRPTSSPAALMRHMLQHPSRRQPATDAQIDLDRLKHWDGATRAAGREFNGVFDAKTSLYEALTRVARLGRAVPTLRDLKFSVVIDEPRTVPVRLFTPRNSWGYEAEMTHEPAPHGYRIAFVNIEADWKTEELVVYDDGYTATNATLIDRVEIVGITSRDQAHKEGRFHLAQQRLRREVHRLTTDFEQLACERGDLVALQHDVIATGLGSGRIAAVTDDATKVLDVTLDTDVTMLPDRTYGLRVRRVLAGAMRTDLYRLKTIAGQSPRLYFADPPARVDGPAVGDLAAFGELERETLRVLIRDIEPAENLSARLTLIAEAPGVHTAEQGPIPPYDPVVTLPSTVPAPVVLGIVSDERAMLLTPSRTLIDRVIFQLSPVVFAGTTLHVLYRIAGTDGAWQQATLQEETATSAIIEGLRSGEAYDFRLQYTHPNYRASLQAQVNAHYVAGRTSPPADLQNLSLAVLGGSALLRWDLPGDLDVQIGGHVLFRHSPDMAATSWPDSTSLARTVAGDQTYVLLPLKPGTYFARAHDAGNRPSDGFSSVSTKQASVLAFSPVGSVQEDPAFPGTRTRCAVDSDALTLIIDDFDDVPDVDALADWDSIGGVAVTGLYQFSAGIDAGSVKRLRLTSTVQISAVNQYDIWDSKVGEIDSWSDIDGTEGASVDASVWGRLTDDDPAGTPTWGPLMRIDSAEVDARAIGQIECRMISDDGLFNLLITQLRVAAEAVA